MTLLGQLITDMVEKQNFENKVKILSEPSFKGKNQTYKGPTKC